MVIIMDFISRINRSNDIKNNIYADYFIIIHIFDDFVTDIIIGLYCMEGTMNTI